MDSIAASAKQNLINATSFVYEDYHIINHWKGGLLVEAGSVIVFKAAKQKAQQMLSPFWREVVFSANNVEVGSWPTKLCNSFCLRYYRRIRRAKDGSWAAALHWAA